MSTSTLLERLAISSPSTDPASAEPCTPWIPPELISLILAELWQGAHTPEVRSTLLVKLALVNRTWLTLIAHVTTLDVHISNHKEAMAFLGLLAEPLSTRESHDLLTMERKRAVHQSCRSLTCHVDGRRRSTNPPNDAGPVVPSIVFRELSAIPHFPPHLRHISLSHINWPQNRIFYLFRAAAVPPRVTHLSLDYSFTSASLAARVLPFHRNHALFSISMQHRDVPIAPHPRAPNLRHISLSGVTVPTAFAAIILVICPNVETLELTRPERLSDLAPLPPAVRTLVLGHPGVALSEGEVGSWALPEALGAGLFPTREKPPRIVVRSPGAPDPTVFMALRRSCERFDVGLVCEHRFLTETS